MPNPWTMGIMNVLSELHQEHDLKLNLKFEIEVLCKTLNVDIGDLRPSMYLRNPALLIMLEVQVRNFECCRVRLIVSDDPWTDRDH